MSKNPLQKHRSAVDAIDNELLALLNKRAHEVEAIGRIKAENGEQVFSSARERAILDRLSDLNKGPLPLEAMNDIFQAVFTAHRSLQRKLQIAYFGPEATFTHQLAVKHFGRNCEYTPLPTIRDVFNEVETKRADYGVVPIENSTEGIVNHTLDMFINSDLVIVAEREEPITQYLFSVSGDLKKVKGVYSHPQALAQCRKWLEARLPHATIHETLSTADAAVHATLDPTAAAIASQAAGEIYHLRTVASKIEDTIDNTTRFLIIGRDIATPTGKDKTSVLFSVKDRVGALYDILQVFKKAGLNMTKIESRPTRKKVWEYIFFVDFIGHQSDKKVQKALLELRRKCAHIKVLGSYPYGA
jgi:chorismate mutase/prephenate dehydratase